MSSSVKQTAQDFGPLTSFLNMLPSGPNLPGLRDQPADQATLAAIADLFALPSELGLEQLLPAGAQGGSASARVGQQAARNAAARRRGALRA